MYSIYSYFYVDYLLFLRFLTVVELLRLRPFFFVFALFIFFIILLSDNCSFAVIYRFFDVSLLECRDDHNFEAQEFIHKNAVCEGSEDP